MAARDWQRQERSNGTRFPLGTAVVVRDESMDVLAMAIAQDDTTPIETIAQSLDKQAPREAYVGNVFLLCYKIAKLQCRHQAQFDDYFAAGVDVAFRLVEWDEFAKLASAERIAYAFRSISNEIINQHRKKEAESRGIERLFHEQRAETKCRRNGIEELEHNEYIHSQMKRVEQCLVGGELLAGDREIFEVIREKGDISSQELAEELGTTVDNARQRLHRAKKRIRKALCVAGHPEDQAPSCSKKPGRATARRKKPVVTPSDLDSASPLTMAGATLSATAPYPLQDAEQQAAPPIW